MASNVYTKNEILKELSTRGYFIDSYTLDTFFEKWKVEAIFEDEQGSEFYDKSALDLVLAKLFGADPNEKEKEKQEAPRELKPPKQNVEPLSAEIRPQEPIIQPNAIQQNIIQPNQIPAQPYVAPMPFQQAQQPMYQIPAQPYVAPIPFQPAQPMYQMPAQAQSAPVQPKKYNLNDIDGIDILNDISLTDGTPLLNKIQENTEFDKIVEPVKAPAPSEIVMPKPEKKTKPGILEGALKAANQDNITIKQDAPIEAQEGNGDDFDDISLLSESLEAQEKFRQYVVSELEKKNLDVTPKNNEFKLDISERTISMLARTMARKIVKNVNAIFNSEAKNNTQIEEIKEENKKLEQKALKLEEQNKKLRLLLTESNKNLNSYQPSIFGLYKKVPPKK